MQFSFVELEQARLHNITSLSGTLSTQHKGTVAFLTTDSLPYYWNGTAWKTLANSFLELSDTDPTTYTANNGYFVHVNNTPSGLEFSTRMKAYGSSGHIQLNWLSGDSLPTLYVGSTSFSNTQTAIVAYSGSGSAGFFSSGGTGAGTFAIEATNTAGAGGSPSIKATGSADFVPVIWAVNSGSNGYGIKAEGSQRGVHAVSSGSTAVYAEGATYGIYVTASNAAAKGVSSNTSGLSAYAFEGIGGARGGYFSGTAYGVYGSSSSNVGVYGSGGSHGVQADGNNAGSYGVHGTGATYGVYGNADGGSGTTYGVYGANIGGGTTAYGVFGLASAGTNRYGVYGESSGYGVYAKTTGSNKDALYADAATLSSRAVVGISAGATASFPTSYFENTGSPSGANVANAIYAKITTATNVNSAVAIFEVTSTDNGTNNTYALLATARNSVASFTATFGASATAAVFAAHKNGYAFNAKLTGSSSGGSACAFMYDQSQDGGATDTKGIYCQNSAASYATATFINANTGGTAVLVEGGSSTGVGIKVNVGQTGIWNTKRTLLDQQVRFTAAGFTAVNGVQDNINIPDAVFIRVTGPTAGFTIRGITNVADGRYILLANRSGQIMTLANQNANSTAANRIITGSGADLAFAADSVVVLVYDNTTQRWLVIA